MARHKRPWKSHLSRGGKHRRHGRVSELNLPQRATTATLGLVLLSTLSLSRPETKIPPQMVQADRVLKVSRDSARRPLEAPPVERTIEFPKISVTDPTPTPKPRKKKATKKIAKKPEVKISKPIKKKITIKKPPVVERKTIIKTPGLDFSPCTDSAGIESGIHLNAINLYRAVCHAFPEVGPFGGYRNESGSFHQLGRAVDCMVSSHSIGERLKDWVYAHRKELHVMEIIWEQHIWTAQRASEGFRPMSDRGSPTANHMDHVHVTLF